MADVVLFLMLIASTVLNVVLAGLWSDTKVALKNFECSYDELMKEFVDVSNHLREKAVASEHLRASEVQAAETAIIDEMRRLSRLR